MASPSSRPTTLRATYTSPGAIQQFTFPVPTSSSSATQTTAERIAHLSFLRSSTKALQQEINVYLTAKMEEDKIAAARAAEEGEINNQAGEAGGQKANGRKGNSKGNEDRQEELYGEETLEDDEGF